MADQNLLNYVKKIIYSLVISTPDRVTLTRLKHDYAREEGCPIPIRRLGFNNIEGLLHSIPDTVTLVGTGPMAQVLAKKHASTAHIQNLVRSQKKPKNHKRSFKSSERSDLVFVNEQQYVGKSVQEINLTNGTKSMVNSIEKQMEHEEAAKLDNSSIQNLSSTKISDKPPTRTSAVNLSFKLNDDRSWDGGDYFSSDEGSDTDAVPEFAVDERVLSVDYPKDAVRFGYGLPEQNIPEILKLKEAIEVQLITVASPSSFYFWIHDEKYENYKAMYYNMQQFYSTIDDNYTLPLCLMVVGHLGALHVGNVGWLRVQVLSIKTGHKKNIEVELIDTGERMWICHANLKYLCKKFATLPRQCWPGKLAYITPKQGTCFSAEASNHFYSLVCDRSLYAQVCKINADNICTMMLADFAAEKNINVEIIKSGCARRSYDIE